MKYFREANGSQGEGHPGHFSSGNNFEGRDTGQESMSRECVHIKRKGIEPAEIIKAEKISQ